MVNILFPVPIVSAIVERERDGQIEILLQTRWKPDKDPEYSGALEIPAGTLEKYEDVYTALRREMYEETGLKVVRIWPNIQTKTYTRNGDEVFAFMPFCCQQQVQGKQRVGFVFICEVEDKEVHSNPEEARDPQWVDLNTLRHMIEESPEKFFTFQLGALEYYLHYRERT